jgi:hypothetical protein
VHLQFKLRSSLQVHGIVSVRSPVVVVSANNDLRLDDKQFSSLPGQHRPPTFKETFARTTVHASPVWFQAATTAGSTLPMPLEEKL